MAPTCFGRSSCLVQSYFAHDRIRVVPQAPHQVIPPEYGRRFSCVLMIMSRAVCIETSHLPWPRGSVSEPRMYAEPDGCDVFPSASIQPVSRGMSEPGQLWPFMQVPTLTSQTQSKAANPPPPQTSDRSEYQGRSGLARVESAGGAHGNGYRGNSMRVARRTRRPWRHLLKVSYAALLH
jgi:hypothetical protein